MAQYGNPEVFEDKLFTYEQAIQGIEGAPPQWKRVKDLYVQDIPSLKQELSREWDIHSDVLQKPQASANHR